MKAYIVGGAVRDALLGLPQADRDWVVVGATPEAMEAAGFRAVGKDFPVFLHPQTREEYALARTERKTAPGYRGFVVHAAPDVTLEEDLQRRDLTINAIAQDESGALIDPWGGVADLEARLFRHVSPAFSEDPVRILRVARFAARFPEFSLAPETLAMMRQMVAAGEVDHLVAERVWQEVSRGLSAQRPARMLALLDECGALGRLLPELDTAEARLCRPLLDQAAERGLGLAPRYALMLAPLTQAELADALSARLKVPLECRALARLLVAESRYLARLDPHDAEELVAFFDRCDAWRRPQRTLDLLDAASVLSARTELGPARLALDAGRSVDGGAIAGQCSDKAAIPARIHAARITRIRDALATG